MKCVLIVVDVSGWAWDFMARGIKKYAPNDFQVEIVDQRQFGKFNANAGVLAKYDGISQCSWVESSTAIPFWGKKTTWVASHGLEFDYPPDDLCEYPSRIATQLRNRKTAAERLPHFDALLCVSDALTDIASEFHDNCIRVVPGVDRDVFVRREFKPLSSPPVIGWCGQKLGRTKGYDEVLIPLMDRLGDYAEWKVNARGAGEPLSQQEMVDWYHSLDLFLTTSFSEGCQMPVLEALSCGVPVIGTECGCIWECVPDEQIVPAPEFDRDFVHVVNHLEQKIRHGSVSDPEPYAVKFDWKERSREWLQAMV